MSEASSAGVLHAALRAWVAEDDVPNTPTGGPPGSSSGFEAARRSVAKADAADAEGEDEDEMAPGPAYRMEGPIAPDAFDLVPLRTAGARRRAAMMLFRYLG